MLQDNVDIIMPVWNNCEVTQRALESVVRHTSGDWRLIIIDNASTAPTRQYLQDFSRAHKDCITLIRNEENLGFIKATNQGLKASRAAFACLLNNDVVVTDGWLAGLLRVAKLREDIGIVNPTWTQDLASVDRQAEARAKSARDHFMETNDCMGFCFLIARKVVEKIGLLDECYGRGGREDSDYCKRAIYEGFRCVRALGVLVFHKENTTFDLIPHWRKERKANEDLFEKRWGRRLHAAVLLEGSACDRQAQEFLKEIVVFARLGVRTHLWFLRSEKPTPLFGTTAADAFTMHNNIKVRQWEGAGAPLVGGARYAYRRILFALWVFSKNFKRAKLSAVVIPQEKTRRCFLPFRFLSSAPCEESFCAAGPFRGLCAIQKTLLQKAL